MKRILKISILGALCIFGLGLLNAFAGGPILQLQETNYNFGEVEEGAVVSHDFKMSNPGTEVLEIKEVKPG